MKFLRNCNRNGICRYLVSSIVDMLDC